MKQLRVLLAILIALAVTGVGVQAASAADPITGTVLAETTAGYWDDTAQAWVPGVVEPMAGVTVSAYPPAKDGSPAPKPLVSTETGLDGTFSLDVGLGPVCVEVQPPSQWQSGWAYAGVPGIYAQPPEVCDLMAGASLGEIVLNSADGWGYVVDANGDPIRGAVVKYLPYDFTGRVFSAMTDASGYYLITGLDYEEMEVRVTARKYLSGWVSASGDVVSTWGEASTFGTGGIGTLDHEIRMTLR
ncbi:carboxypeptidase-like regulatory domain-containing protein [Tessaracoccus lapidicaptus]|uniref:carboxypeptidase-like regulatory domain-containing protein n=1 Tax=Tessaracoccus lapidicaptus TaxID=1427523 RepID=UPI00333FD3D7